MAELLLCEPRDYAWGHHSAIQDLTGLGDHGAPIAELWMGAHPSAPSLLASSGEQLDAAIAADPDRHLGAAASSGRLPFLFKVLAARLPLSIQTHPSLAQAQSGWERENAAGVALGAATRTYRDDNHKPELICALEAFTARVGFRPAAELAGRLRCLVDLIAQDPSVEWSEWIDRADALALTASDTADYRPLLDWLFERPDQTTAAMVTQLVAAAAAARDNSIDFSDGCPVSLADESSWIVQTALENPDDVGNLVAILLNPVRLDEGEAVFLPAGNLHAYLSGVGVELMANSDNVIRGGLTPKHIDRDELMAVVDGSPLHADVQRPEAAVHTYRSPVPEFSLTVVRESELTCERGPGIVLVTDGTANIASVEEEALDSEALDGEVLDVGRGQVAWLPAAEFPLRLRTSGTAWLATIGDSE